MCGSDGRRRIRPFYCILDNSRICLRLHQLGNTVIPDRRNMCTFLGDLPYSQYETIKCMLVCERQRGDIRTSEGIAGCSASILHNAGSWKGSLKRFSVRSHESAASVVT